MNPPTKTPPTKTSTGRVTKAKLRRKPHSRSPSVLEDGIVNSDDDTTDQLDQMAKVFHTTFGRTTTNPTVLHLLGNNDHVSAAELCQQSVGLARLFIAFKYKLRMLYPLEVLNRVLFGAKPLDENVLRASVPAMMAMKLFVHALLNYRLLPSRTRLLSEYIKTYAQDAVTRAVLAQESDPESDSEEEKDEFGVPLDSDLKDVCRLVEQMVADSFSLDNNTANQVVAGLADMLNAGLLPKELRMDYVLVGHGRSLFDDMHVYLAESAGSLYYLNNLDGGGDGDVYHLIEVSICDKVPIVRVFDNFVKTSKCPVMLACEETGRVVVPNWCMPNMLGLIKNRTSFCLKTFRTLTKNIEVPFIDTHSMALHLVNRTGRVEDVFFNDLAEKKSNEVAHVLALALLNHFRAVCDSLWVTKPKNEAALKRLVLKIKRWIVITKDINDHELSYAMQKGYEEEWNHIQIPSEKLDAMTSSVCEDSYMAEVTRSLI
jgi:hypothetical protein